MVIQQTASMSTPGTLRQSHSLTGKRGKSILVVDDDPDARDFIYWTLFPLGYDISQAGSGDECLEKMMNRRFDLLLLDLRMPGMDGMEVLEKARARHPGTCVILISAYADWPDYFLAVTKGARDVIPKPLSCNELLRVVWAALSDGESPSGGRAGFDTPPPPGGGADDRPSAAT